jgi:uncharacterized membrane protein YphA (DoxX/SURF4 family)
MNIQKISSFAPTLLRLSMAAVFAWFGTSQIIKTSSWTALVPSLATSMLGLSAETIVFVNGIFEVIASLLLATGIFIRPVALLLSLHLFGIMASLGNTPTGVRDFGLSCATLAIALFGNDPLSLARAIKKDSNALPR